MAGPGGWFHNPSLRGRFWGGGRFFFVFFLVWLDLLIVLDLVCFDVLLVGLRVMKGNHFDVFVARRRAFGLFFRQADDEKVAAKARGQGEIPGVVEYYSFGEI